MSSTAVTWIVIGVIVVLVLWIISIYNGLVAMRQRVNQAFSDIDVQTKQRHDLIPNLVETVKGYAGHERGTLEAVVQARNAAIAAQSGGVAAQAAAENVLTGALRQLFALSEAYPDLKASQNFQQHRGELLDAGVVFLHRVVEEAARGGDLVLDVGELGLELLEVLAGLEIGVSLAQGEQLPQRSSERVLGRGLGGDPARLRRNRGVARLHHGFQPKQFFDVGAEERKQLDQAPQVKF